MIGYGGRTRRAQYPVVPSFKFFASRLLCRARAASFPQSAKAFTVGSGGRRLVSRECFIVRIREAATWVRPGARRTLPSCSFDRLPRREAGASVKAAACVAKKTRYWLPLGRSFLNRRLPPVSRTLWSSIGGGT